MSSRAIFIGLIAIALVGGGALYVLRSRPAPPESKPVAAAPKPAAPAVRAPAPGPEPAPAEPAPRKTAPRKSAPAPAAPAPAAAPTTATLMLDTDVPGASVFINREYVGTTPLKLDKLEPGEKQFKLTADGYDGIERKVELVAGDNPVTLKFKEVRLNQRIGVTHKHAMGSCEGTLIATLDGLTYETSNKGDAFKLSYAQVDTFVVDYLEKNLKVKQKGGKQWNFTDKAAANADALFVFHREVEAARKKLAEGYAPVR